MKGWKIVKVWSLESFWNSSRKNNILRKLVHPFSEYLFFHSTLFHFLILILSLSLLIFLCLSLCHYLNLDLSLYISLSFYLLLSHYWSFSVYLSLILSLTLYLSVSVYLIIPLTQYLSHSRSLPLFLSLSFFCETVIPKTLPSFSVRFFFFLFSFHLFYFSLSLHLFWCGRSCQGDCSQTPNDTSALLHLSKMCYLSLKKRERGKSTWDDDRCKSHWNVCCWIRKLYFLIQQRWDRKKVLMVMERVVLTRWKYFQGHLTNCTHLLTRTGQLFDTNHWGPVNALSKAPYNVENIPRSVSSL